MRFAVFSDIHGNLSALKAVFSDIDSLDEELEFIVCLGDVVGHAAHPNEVIDLLKEREVKVIRGNYDELVLQRRANSGADFPTQAEQSDDIAAALWTISKLTPENKEYLAKLPGDTRFEVSPSGRPAGKLRESERASDAARRGYLASMVGGSLLGMGRRPRRVRLRKVLFVHGSPRDVIENLYPDSGQSVLRTVADKANADLIVSGHTRQSYQREVGSTMFVGVGALGWPQFPGVAEYALFDCANDELAVEFREVEYDPVSEADDAERSGLPRRMADRLREGHTSQLVS